MLRRMLQTVWYTTRMFCARAVEGGSAAPQKTRAGGSLTGIEVGGLDACLRLTIIGDLVCRRDIDVEKRVPGEVDDGHTREHVRVSARAYPDADTCEKHVRRAVICMGSAGPTRNRDDAFCGWCHGCWSAGRADPSLILPLPLYSSLSPGTDVCREPGKW